MRFALPLLLAAMLAAPGAAQAQRFTDEALVGLYATVGSYQKITQACSAAVPALAPSLEGALGRVREAHAADLVEARAVAERIMRGTDRTLADLDTQIAAFEPPLASRDAAGRKSWCESGLRQMDATAAKSRQDLVADRFNIWLADLERVQRATCRGLDEQVRVLARRLLASRDRRADPPLDAQEVSLAPQAVQAEKTAGTCLSAQQAAAREGVTLPGDYTAIRDTAAAIADAASPRTRNVPPEQAGETGEARARAYLETPKPQ